MSLTVPDILVGVVLFACVPLQYFIVQNWGNVESSRSYGLHKLLRHLIKFRDEYLVLDSWKKWVVQQLNLADRFPTFSDSDPDVLESPAIEVMQYKHKHGYFSFSLDPRTSRPPIVEFRIGQVVMHKNWKYRGVIVGWDETAKAPLEWLDEKHGKENIRWREMPNYSILVDTRDRLNPQITYVPQENIIAIQDTRILHPLLDIHFESFDGAQYIPRPWLRAIYPQD